MTPAGGSDRGTGRRDRDAEGRARNARPRDALGRPLPYGSPDVARAPEGVVREPAETLDQAQGFLERGLPFHAHEVFEDAWKSSVGVERGLWKGLAQLAVGLTHLARGNARGARTLLDRGRTAIAPFDPAPYGIDAPSIIGWATALIDELQSPGAPAGVSWSAPALRGRPPLLPESLPESLTESLTEPQRSYPNPVAIPPGLAAPVEGVGAEPHSAGQQQAQHGEHADRDQQSGDDRPR